jgi:hypothetical protein
VEGEIVTCQSSDIEGTVNGKITCQDLLSLKATAKLQRRHPHQEAGHRAGRRIRRQLQHGRWYGTESMPEPTRSSFSSSPITPKDAAGTSRPEPARTTN